MAAQNFCLVTTEDGTAIAGFLSYLMAEKWAADNSRRTKLFVSDDLTQRRSTFDNAERVFYDAGLFASQEREAA